jgi:hypothetical protein
MALYHSPLVVTDGLVLYLDAANTKSYPGSGTAWNDLSQNGNNAALVNGLLFTNTGSGELFMDGGDEYIRIPPSSNLSNYFSTGSFTVETIVRSTNVSYPQSRHPIYVNGTVVGTAYRGWSAGHNSTSTQIEIRVSDGTNFSSGYISHTVAQSTPYHRVFTVDRTFGCSTNYYVNSALIGNHNATSVTGSIYDGTTTDFQTGMVFGYVWGWRYIGGISIIKVYNKVLSQAEITQNFNALRTRFGI